MTINRPCTFQACSNPRLHVTLRCFNAASSTLRPDLFGQLTRKTAVKTSFAPLLHQVDSRSAIGATKIYCAPHQARNRILPPAKTMQCEADLIASRGSNHERRPHAARREHRDEHSPPLFLDGCKKVRANAPTGHKPNSRPHYAFAIVFRGMGIGALCETTVFRLLPFVIWFTRRPAIRHEIEQRFHKAWVTGSITIAEHYYYTDRSKWFLEN